MKFKSLGHTNVKTFRVDGFSGGVNYNDLPENAGDSQMTDCLNMYNNENIVETRPGLSAELTNILRSQSADSTNISNYILTDTDVYIDGENKKIAVADVLVDSSVHYSYVYFISKDKISTEAGFMQFSRVTGDTFYEPVNYIFYTGKSSFGGGIYCFITLQNGIKISDRCYKIYEINSSYDGWVEINDFYNPVVYINGRGNKYEIAKSAGKGYSSSPINLETQNLLGGRFKAYFSSDGYSNCFRLPLSNLSTSFIKCRIYRSLTEYTEWNILDNTNYASAQFFNIDVTITVDREKGIIYFKNSEGDYPIPEMSLYHENNILISAEKISEEGVDDIVSSTCIAKNESRVFLSGGIKKNKVYSVSFDNPLYFQSSSRISIGDCKSPVTALCLQGSKIIAFKETGIYSISFKNGEKINNNSLLADNDREFYRPDIMVCSIINSDIGCIYKNTVAACGTQIVFLGADKKIYTLNGEDIFNISTMVQPVLNNLNFTDLLSSFAIGKQGFYLLKTRTKAVIMKYDTKSIECPKSGVKSISSYGVKWFIWNFNDKIHIIGGFTLYEKTLFLCVGNDGNVCYIASLEGNTDSNIFVNEKQNTVDNLKIPCSFKTRKFNFSEYEKLKFIQSVFVSINSYEDAIISFNKDKINNFETTLRPRYETTNNLEAVKIIPCFNGTNSFQIEFNCESYLKVGKMTVYYTLGN